MRDLPLQDRKAGVAAASGGSGCWITIGSQQQRLLPWSYLDQGGLRVITPQNGIFAQGTHSHYFLELDILPGRSANSALASLRRLRSPEVSAGGVNFVLAFGADFWRLIASDQAPPDLGPFSEIPGPSGKHAPARQHAGYRVRSRTCGMARDSRCRQPGHGAAVFRLSRQPRSNRFY